MTAAPPQLESVRAGLAEVHVLRAAAARAIDPVRGRDAAASSFVMEGVALAGLAMMRLWLAPGRSLAETAIGAATLIENLLAGGDGRDDPAVASVAGAFARTELATGETPLDVAMLGLLDEEGPGGAKGFASFKAFIASLPEDDQDSQAARHAGEIAISIYTAAARMADLDTFTALAWSAASALRSMGLDPGRADMKEWM